jgi:hypothetical protein
MLQVTKQDKSIPNANDLGWNSFIPLNLLWFNYFYG